MSWQDAYLRELEKLRFRYTPASPLRAIIQEDTMRDMPKSPFSLCLHTGRIYRENAPPYAVKLEGLHSLPDWARAVKLQETEVKARPDGHYEVCWLRGARRPTRANIIVRQTRELAWADFLRSFEEMPQELTVLTHELDIPRVIGVDMLHGWLYREGDDWGVSDHELMFPQPLLVPPEARWIDHRAIRIRQKDGSSLWTVYERQPPGSDVAFLPVTLEYPTREQALLMYLTITPGAFSKQRFSSSRFPQWSTITGRIERPGQVASELQHSYAKAALDFARPGGDRAGVVFKHDPARKYLEVDYADLEAKLLAGLIDLGDERGELRNTPETREAVKERVWQQLYGLVGDRGLSFEGAKALQEKFLRGDYPNVGRWVDEQKALLRQSKGRVTRVDPNETHTVHIHRLDHRVDSAGSPMHYLARKQRDLADCLAGATASMGDAFKGVTRAAKNLSEALDGLDLGALDLGAEGWEPCPLAEPPTGPFDPREFAVGRPLSSQAQIGGVHPAFSRAVPSPSEKTPEPVVSVQWSGDQTPMALDRRARFVQAVRDAAALFPNYQPADWHFFLNEVDRRVKELRFEGGVGVKGHNEPEHSTMAVRFTDVLKRSGYRVDLQLRIEGEGRDARRTRAFEFLRDLTVG